MDSFPWKFEDCSNDQMLGDSASNSTDFDFSGNDWMADDMMGNYTNSTGTDYPN